MRVQRTVDLLIVLELLVERVAFVDRLLEGLGFVVILEDSIIVGESLVVHLEEVFELFCSIKILMNLLVT